MLGGHRFRGSEAAEVAGRDPAGVTVTLAAGVAYEVVSLVVLGRQGCETEAG